MPDVAYRLALDHAGHGGTGQIQEWLNVHVVGRQDEFKQEDLFEVDKVRVPFLDDVGHVLALERLFNFRHGFLQVMFAKFNHLLEDFRLDVGQRDFRHLLLFLVVIGVIILILFHHGLDEFRHVGDGDRDQVFLSILGDLLYTTSRNNKKSKQR